MLSKKTISPVIATALLFVVAVSAVVGFQNFFSRVYFRVRDYFQK